MYTCDMHAVDGITVVRFDDTTDCCTKDVDHIYGDIILCLSQSRYTNDWLYSDFQMPSEISLSAFLVLLYSDFHRILLTSVMPCQSGLL